MEHKSIVNTEIRKRLDLSKFYKERIPSLQINGKPEAIGLCPLHNDTHPSFNVNLDTGLYLCRACGAKGDVFRFYMETNGVNYPIAEKELAVIAGVTDTSKSRIVAAYKYTDMSGNLLYIKERISPGRNGKSKEFFFKHSGGMGRGCCDPVLYRLPEIIPAKEVYITEGEAKADLLHEWGLTATCLDAGSNSPWRAEYSEAFKGKEKVVIMPDKDKPGNEYALKIANALHDKVDSLKVVGLPGLSEKGDIIDWAAIPGNDKARLSEIIKAAPAWTPDVSAGVKLFDMSKALKLGGELQELDIKVDWLIPGLIPERAITLFSARGGMGKTLLSILMAKAVSEGLPFLGLDTKKTQAVYIDFENALPVLVERVKHVNASQVWFWHASNETPPPKIDSKGFELFKQLPKESLLIVDTLRASQTKDENDSTAMAVVMQRLKELRDVGFTVVLLHHTKKSDDKTYKGSTVIYDLSDHILSLHKVKRGFSADDTENDEDDEDDCLYRFGTKDKTRYEPFSMFLEFDHEAKGFRVAPDPKSETMLDIQNLLNEKGTMKTNDIFELAKTKLGIKSKGKITRVLKKGIGTYWTAERGSDNKTVFYTAKIISPEFSSIGLDYRTNEKSLVQNSRTNAHQKSLETLVNSDKSVNPDQKGLMGLTTKSLVQSDWTNDVKNETDGTNEFDENDNEIFEVGEMEVVSNV